MNRLSIDVKQKPKTGTNLIHAKICAANGSKHPGIGVVGEHVALAHEEASFEFN